PRPTAPPGDAPPPSLTAGPPRALRAPRVYHGRLLRRHDEIDPPAGLARPVDARPGAARRRQVRDEQDEGDLEAHAPARDPAARRDRLRGRRQPRPRRFRPPPRRDPAAGPGGG